MRLIFFSLAAALSWTSCQTETAVSGDALLPSDARALYVIKCAKCHELYDPKKYDGADWKRWMVKMKKKSKLKPEQFDLILDYTTKLRVPESGPIEVQPGR